MPSAAPTAASVPAVTAAMPRRVDGRAPVAVSVRKSPADSPRIRPSVAAITPSATTMPTSPAMSRIRCSWDLSSRVSMRMPYCVAISRASWRSAAFSVCGVSINQRPDGTTFQPRCAATDGSSSDPGSDV